MRARISAKFVALLGRLSAGRSFQSLIVFALKAAGGLSGYLLFALIARQSGVEQFGMFSVLFSAAMMAGMAGSMGQQVFLVKEIPSAQHSQDPHLEGRTYLFSFVATLIGSAVAGLSFYLCAIYFYPDAAISVAIGGALLSVTFAASQTTLGALRIQSRVVLAVASRDVIWRIATAGVIACIPWLLPEHAVDAGSALLVMGATLLAIVLWHAIVLSRRFHGRLSFRGVVSRRWLQLTAGLTLVAVISSADLYIFSIALGGLVPASEVGPFFAAMKTVEVINLLLMSVALVMGPHIARAIAAKNLRRAQAECNTAIAIQGVPAVLACIGVIYFAPQLLGLFDPAFAQHADVLYILTAGVLVNALAGPTVLMLQLVDLHWRQVAMQGGSLLAALALLPAAVDLYGLIGAAYCYALSKLAWNVAAVLSCRRRAGVDPSCLGLFGSGALTYKEGVQEFRRKMTGAVNAKHKV
ncbi:lipopolysaccharide biosynthesis protein [Mycobacterium sp. PS03-16]|uniref:lipopolysaccharide biosynthesis protein n=1 Tax=Mycobacterium sp. PS03-16 TaxID=2559611 RepID=UPI0010738C57|nr:lipopolysaccharide biosynthesis protein [Mycobacterium sp. PS03-16]TFV58190.1 lipopolysaccharide biosynthesis protein [Mycobacterium sp. PS03-16]